MKLEQVLVFNSEKKHSVRYDAVQPTPAVTSIYVMKQAMLGAGFVSWPKQITVTIDAWEEK